jgi:hypothetical protein
MDVAPSLEHDLKSLLKTIGVALLLQPAIVQSAMYVVVIEGLDGEPRYAEQFEEQIAAIEEAAQSLTTPDRVRVFRSGEASRVDVLQFFEDLRSKIAQNDQLALYLVGHGSYDDHEYKFNIQGPDLTGDDLAGMLNGLAGSSQLLVNTGSASGAIAELAAGDNRLLILATRSGAERHATRFGNYFAAALNDPTADLDKNQLVSATEAFEFAERQVDDYYERNGQLATEHPRMEGERGGRFNVSRLGSTRQESDDVVLNELIAKRDQLNAKVDSLRLDEGNMTPQDYRSQLLQNMIELAETEEAIEQRERELSGEN